MDFSKEFVAQPDVIAPNTSPDQIFVVVANVISSPGVFGSSPEKVW